MALHALLVLAASTAPPKLALETPVRAVTVYSDRARVTRTGTVDVNGTRVVELPPLARSVDPRTISVTAAGAELSRVDIAWAPPDALPRTRVEELLDAIAKVDDQLTQLSAEQAAWQGQLDVASALRPQLPPAELGRPQPHLNAGGWGLAIDFARKRVTTAQGMLRDITRRGRPLILERVRLVAEAQKIGAATRQAGYRVVAHLSGHGSAKLSITYMVGRARWRPAYDVQLQPATNLLDLQLAGEVSQETGEDWSDAQLTLSTAEPATTTRYPKVNTWKIGERERFIPTPIAATAQPSPPPPAVPPPATANEDAVLRMQLASMTERSRTSALQEQVLLGAKWGRLDGRLESTPKPPAKGAAEDHDGFIDTDESERDGDSKDAPTAAEAPVDVAKNLAPAPSQPMVAAAQLAPESATKKRRFKRDAKKESVAEESGPSESVGLVAPRGWSRPSYASDLPASLAGGYDLVFSALQPETVLSGQGTRRVALLSRHWPVSVERKIFPALAPDAFLVATIASRDDKPLPGGKGQLFVGSDPAGTAQLPLIRPGEPVTLPLGLDRAIRPIRNVKVVTTERGLINKEEISEYTVTIEVANPYAKEIPLRVVDQLPVLGDTGAKNVEVKLVRTEPALATHDDTRGTLEWKVPLAASGKSTITFVYTIRRPKGFELRQ